MHPRGERFAFGPFQIWPEAGELWRDGRRQRLAPQPFQVLALLVVRAPHLVTRDELRAAVWADGTTVEFDQGLNYCIRQIRIALQDAAREPRYVETVPKRGYRLLVQVAASGGLAVAPAPPIRSRAWWLPVTAAGAAGLLLVGAWFVGDRVAARVPEGDQARRLFLEAEHLADTWEADKVRTAASRYQEVTRLDPGFAGAWAGLANANIVLAFLGPDPARAVADAERHARQALSLDDSLAVAHAALGHSYWQQWRWVEADEAFQRAMAADPASSVAHQLYGLYLASAGRPQEAVRHARRAVELAPVSGLMSHALAVVYLQTGDFESAIAQARHTLDIDRHFPLAYQTLIRAYIQAGRLEEAWQALEDAARFVSRNDAGPWRAYLLARLGRLPEARTALMERRRAGSAGRASLSDAAALVAMGDMEAALARLEEGLAARVPSLIWLQTAPELAPLRGDPRFAALVGRLRANGRDGQVGARRAG